MAERDTFDPRQAALNHAGAARLSVIDENESAMLPRFTINAQDPASAIACGLVYIGDVLGNHLSAIVNLLETLDATVSNGLAEIAKELE
jgi:hypothetical protein